ncbi:MAG: phage tail-like protein [Natronomonas sp.]|jgi:phage tail-like protein
MTNDKSGIIPDMDRRGLMQAVGLAGLASVAAGQASAQDRRGPARKTYFSVTIDDIEVPGWVEVQLPDARIGKGEYRTGNEPDEDRQLWGRADYDPLVIKRGVEPATGPPGESNPGGAPVGTKLFDWFKKVKDGKVAESRKQITVEVYNETGSVAGAPVAKWVFDEAWPIEYSPPTLDAGARGEVAMEGLTLAFYDYQRESP